MALEAREIVREWAGGGAPEDDMTVVVLKRHHGPAPVAEERRMTGSMPIPKPA